MSTSQTYGRYLKSQVMEGGDTTRRKERSSTISKSLSLEVVPLDSVHHSKRSKRSSPASTTRSNSKLMNNTIDDLPDVVLVDILSRLPCFDFVLKCKSVCKRWSILMSDPYFIGRFLLRLQSRHTPIPPLTLINKKGENFPMAFNPLSPLKFLTRMFLRLMSSLSLKKEPVVVGACNDLVLCCASEYFQRDYFICNPYTTQWVALPPVSRVLRDVPVGFICDPYYNYHKKEEEVHQPKSTFIQDKLININVDYRCMVVRILPYDDTFEDDLSYKFKVEIFSFEIGEWRESIISFPQRFTLNDINSDVHFAHNEMLYWSSIWGHHNFLIGLNPFMISDVTNNIRTSSTSNSNSDDNHQYYYKCRYIELVVKDAYYDELSYLHKRQLQGVLVHGAGGCLQICLLDAEHSAFIWEVKKEEDDLMIAADGAGKLHAKHLLLPLAKEMELIALDPNNEGYLYVRLNGSLFELINLRRSLLCEMNMPERGRIISNYCFFPLKAKPWWPTPVPRIPHPSA